MTQEDTARPDAHTDGCGCMLCRTEAIADHGKISIMTPARIIADRTVPEDGSYRSNGQYRREWKIARDAALDALALPKAGSSGQR